MDKKRLLLQLLLPCEDVPCHMLSVCVCVCAQTSPRLLFYSSHITEYTGIRLALHPDWLRPYLPLKSEMVFDHNQ